MGGCRPRFKEALSELSAPEVLSDSGGSSAKTESTSNGSTLVGTTSAPNTTTHANVTSPVPAINTTAIVRSTTSPSNTTATTNGKGSQQQRREIIALTATLQYYFEPQNGTSGTTLMTSPSTTQSRATSISVPTKSSPVTSTSSSAAVTVTPASASQKKTSSFDAGSFIGGIVLTLGILIVLYLGCKFYASKRGVQYRTIDEHEAII